MQLENYEQLKLAVEAADMVLVGLGEEWVLNEDIILEDLKNRNKLFYEMFSIAAKEELYQKLLPFLMAYYYEKYIPAMWKSAYENLSELLEGKNYFLVSLTVDSYLRDIGFKEERCVNPCGTYKKMQCDDGCGRTIDVAVELINKIGQLVENGQEFDSGSQEIKKVMDKALSICGDLHCEKCGSDIVFNLLEAKKYLEDGYLEQWQIYMKWLQGTLNRKLLVIEAGAGMKLPSVIRWPFEKTVFYNQKANMIRIHQKYYQVNEEIAERSYGCKCYSVQLFKEKNLEA